MPAHLGVDADPVEVSGELPGDVGLAARREADKGDDVLGRVEGVVGRAVGDAAGDGDGEVVAELHGRPGEAKTSSILCCVQCHRVLVG